MRKRIIAIDMGHGGWLNGKYQIRKKGAKQFHFPNGESFYEGVHNRVIGKNLFSELSELNLPFVDLNFHYARRHSWLKSVEHDHSLSHRVKVINELTKEYKRKGIELILYSIHFNAGKGTGLEVFTSPGETSSDGIATLYAKSSKEVMPNLRFRADYSDGDPDKEAKFYILVNTHCPAILTENGFFDNYKEFKWMTSPKGISQITEIGVKTIQSIYNLEDVRV